MAITYPTTLDTLTNPTSANKLNTTGVEHATQHSNANDAIEALEAKVGVNSSAVTSSLDYWMRTGWISVSDTWTYASATTITVPSGATSLYQIGDKLMFTQTTVKYFIIVAVADTLITVAPSVEYTVANAAISSIAYSRNTNPLGFPDYFTWAPTLTGFSADPTTASYRYSVQGRTCYLIVRQGTAGTSNATTFTMTAPITSSSSSNSIGGAPTWKCIDNTVQLTTPGRAYISTGTATITVDKDVSGGAWTGSGTKCVNFELFYPI